MPLTNSNSSSSSHHATGGDPLASLEEILHLSLKNLDDESPVTADGWAEAASRGISTAIRYHEQKKAAAASGPDRGGGSGTGDEGTSPQPSPRFGGGAVGRRFTGLVHSPSLTSVPLAVRYLVDQFVRVGGELAAARAGGTFSTGGRAVRVGYCLTLTRFLRLQQSVLGEIGDSRSISMQTTISSVLGMLGEDMEKQLKPPAGGESAAGPLFGAAVGRTAWSKADAGLVRLSTSRVLRHGVSELAAEPVQLSVLQELLLLLPGGGGQEIASPMGPLNPNQMQVVLIEISHLLATLGEAAASKVEETVTRLRQCLCHEDNGVRHEAAVACAALAASFPSEGRKLVLELLKELQEDHAQIVSSVSSGSDKKADGEQGGGGLRMFLRGAKEKKPESSTAAASAGTTHCAIHGKSLTVSMLIRDLPKLPGGLPRDVLSTALSVAEILVSIQFHEKVTSPVYAQAVCFCIRAGFCMISGVLATGPDGVEPHMPLIVDAWQKATLAAKEGGKVLALHHDLVCLDAILASIVCFLKFCSELLLSVPQALSQVSVLLEDIFPLLQPKGRFGGAPQTAVVAARLESSTAALLEAFAWLPSGSFPMVADEVFAFAEATIQKAVEENVTCSILFSLVTKEDSILDSTTLCRANRDGQVGGARDVEQTIISLTAEIALHNERESVIHLHSDNSVRALGDSPAVFRESCILECFASDLRNDDKAPTPLHEGTYMDSVKSPVLWSFVSASYFYA